MTEPAAVVDRFAGVRNIDLLREYAVIEARAGALTGRSAAVRQELERRAIAEYRETGMKPTWRSPVGLMSFSAPDPDKVVVADKDAFASWIAERFPTEAVTAITGVAADRLGEAIGLLRDAGIDCTAAVEARQPFASNLLKNDAAVLRAEAPEHESCPPPVVVHRQTGEVIDGVVNDPSGREGISIRLSEEAKARAAFEVDEWFDSGVAPAPSTLPLEVTVDEAIAAGLLPGPEEFEAARLADADVIDVDDAGDPFDDDPLCGTACPDGPCDQPQSAHSGAKHRGGNAVTGCKRFTAAAATVAA